MKAEIEAHILILTKIIERLKLKIAKDTKEIARIEDNIVALECAAQCLDKAPSIDVPHKHFVKLKMRKDSKAYKMRKLILEAGHPLHIDDICKGLFGEKVSQARKDSTRGNLNHLCEEMRWFVRTAPQTYGLLEENHEPNNE